VDIVNDKNQQDRSSYLPGNRLQCEMAVQKRVLARAKTNASEIYDARFTRGLPFAGFADFFSSAFGLPMLAMTEKSIRTE